MLRAPSMARIHHTSSGIGAWLRICVARRPAVRLLLCAGLAGAASRPAPAADAWLRARTGNFELFSSAPERRSSDLLMQLEQFRACILSHLGLWPAREPRTTVVLFGSDSGFEPYRPIYQGKPKRVGGVFVPGPDEAVMALTNDLDPSGNADPTELVFHEYVYLMFHTRRLHLPTWLNEGLAEVFSSFRVEGNQAVFGRPKPSYVRLLNVMPLLPLDRLIAVHEKSPEYNEDHQRGLFYAQSWALAHLLVCGEDRRHAGGLERLLQIVGSGTKDTTAAFLEIFGPDLRPLERALQAYLRGGSYVVSRSPLPALSVKTPVAVQPATANERDLALLNLRWRVHQPGDVMLAALQLAERDPLSPRPQELLAAIAFHEGDVDRALERWQAAADRGSDNDYTLVQATRGALRDSGFEQDPGLRLDDATVERLRRVLDGVLARDPAAEEALEMLALTEVRAPAFRISAINRLQEASRTMRRPQRVLLALAFIRVRAGDFATAAHIIEAIQSSERAPADTKNWARLLVSRVPELGRTPAPDDRRAPR
jgi:hypothetical protein